MYERVRIFIFELLNSSQILEITVFRRNGFGTLCFFLKEIKFFDKIIWINVFSINFSQERKNIPALIDTRSNVNTWAVRGRTDPFAENEWKTLKIFLIGALKYWITSNNLLLICLLLILFFLHCLLNIHCLLLYFISFYLLSSGFFSNIVPELFQKIYSNQTYFLSKSEFLWVDPDYVNIQRFCTFLFLYSLN